VAAMLADRGAGFSGVLFTTKRKKNAKNARRRMSIRSPRLRAAMVMSEW
jgi:hypothetical protein